MTFDLLISNITSPALLFFILGIVATQVKSDLQIPSGASKFIALYLLFAIGFKGGMELSHSNFSMEIVYSAILAILLSLLIPVYTFFILRLRLNTFDSGAIAASYGSVSAVTFVTAVSFLELQKANYDGYMVAIMALMESPAIVIGVILMSISNLKSNGDARKFHIRGIVRHSFTNGSVLLILGSLAIGFFSNEQQALGIKPFTNDLFKGFLALFLLDMGLTSGKHLGEFRKQGWFLILFAIVIPLFNGVIASFISSLVTEDPGNRFIFSVLAASASYIAVPAAMKIAAPQANPGLFLPMALAVTFPVNITIGLPLYYSLVS